MLCPSWMTPRSLLVSSLSGFGVHISCLVVLVPPASSFPWQVLGLGGDNSDEAAAGLKLLG